MSQIRVRIAGKVHINDTAMFKQTASVIGKLEAVKQLAIARRSFSWCVLGDCVNSIKDTFIWRYTPQGYKYWSQIHSGVKPDAN